MEKELKELYERLIVEKKNGFFSLVKMVNKEIDSENKEAIMVRSDEFMRSDKDRLPENISILSSEDIQETLGYTYVFYSGEHSGEHSGEQLGEESLAELVARV